MTRKKAGPKRTDTRELEEQEYEEALAIIHTTPSAACAFALKELHPDADFQIMTEQLRQRNQEVRNGDLSVAEAMLIDQAHVLQSIFTKCAARMEGSEYISQSEAYARIALRAQNQCQRTLKTLLEYKNPKRATFIKQQNNAINQQINQGQSPREISEKIIEPAIELLEVNHDARLDTGTPQETVEGNQEMETVGEIDRAED